MQLEEKKIVLDGLSINYVEAGTGQVIIFLHNGGGFWHSWEHQIRYFSKSYKVYGIDWPGFGESDSPDGLISLELLEQVLSSFIETLNLGKVILIGNCIGGSAALKYSLSKPANVKELIIFNICPGTLIYPIKVARKIIPALNNFSVLKTIVRSLFVFAFTKTPVRRKFPKILFGRKFNTESPLSLRYVEKFKEKKQTESRVNLVFSVHTFNLNSLLNGKSAPKHLLAWGSQNSVTSLKKHGYYHHKMLKSKDFKIIQDAGHLCMYEKPEEVNRLIVMYLNGLI